MTDLNEQAFALLVKLIDNGCVYHDRGDWPYCYFCDSPLKGRGAGHEVDCIFIEAEKFVDRLKSNNGENF